MIAKRGTALLGIKIGECHIIAVFNTDIYVKCGDDIKKIGYETVIDYLKNTRYVERVWLFLYLRAFLYNTAPINAPNNSIAKSHRSALVLGVFFTLDSVVDRPELLMVRYAWLYGI